MAADSLANESFTWDSNGNETGTGFTTTTGNEQTASPGYTYTYDNAGEMTSMTQTSTGDVWTYGYDLRGRMVTAVEKTSGGATLESVTYTYDALGNRIGMDENGTQTWTLYDGDTPIMDFNGSGSLTMRYLWGPTGIVARQTSGGTVSWYLADQLGTVRDLINNSGAIIDHVDFSAFGTVIAETSPSSGDRFVGFAGLERDTVTGLNLAVYREENPVTGRWDSEDPAGFAAGDANLDRYVGNGPTRMTDPTGLNGEWSAFGWGLVQGLLNTANGLQNVAIGTANTYYAQLNWTVGWVVPNIPYIKSPDWSRGRAVDESDAVHEWSTYLGGTGAAFLIGRFGPRVGGGFRSKPRSQTSACKAPKTGLTKTTRLTADELATGRRLEARLGKPVNESQHVGAEYTDESGLTYDALRRSKGLAILE